MAGIIGPEAGNMAREIEAMTAALVHRGPDSTGVHLGPGIALGHQRLAIQDLTPAADQPLASPCGRYYLIYNGEIYNFRELREQLGGSFRSTGDTEVLLAAWMKWGERCLEHLKGMFAFLVWDVQSRRGWLVRDRFGIKPLFFAEHRGHVYFASEVKGLL